MSFSSLTQEQIDTLLNVTADSLAMFCGISGKPQTDSEDIQFVNLSRQVRI